MSMYAPVYNLRDISVLWSFVQYNWFMIVVNVNVLAFILHVFKLISLILVKMNCPVRDN